MTDALRTATRAHGKAQTVIENVQILTTVIVDNADSRERVRCWKELLSEYRKALRCLEVSARKRSFNTWANDMQRERKENQDLTYLFHARNVEEHGFEDHFKSSPGGLKIGAFPSFSSVNNLQFQNVTQITRYADGSVRTDKLDGRLSVRDGKITSGGLQTTLPVGRVAGSLVLKTIKDRGVVYDPPVLREDYSDLASQLAVVGAKWLGAKYNDLTDKIDITRSQH